MRDAVLVDRALERSQVGDVAGDVRDRRDRVRVEQQAQPARLGREVERDDVPPVGDELGRDPRADAAVGAGDEEARVAHDGASTHLGVLGRPVDEVRERLRALGQRRVESQSSVEVALGQDLERTRELGARVGELAAQRDRAADEHGHRERRLGVAEPEHHDRRRRSGRPRSPRATSPRTRPRRRRGRPRPARARRRARRRGAPSRSAIARRSGSGIDGRDVRAGARREVDAEQPERPAAEDDGDVAPRHRRAARARRHSRRAARRAPRGAGRVPSGSAHERPPRHRDLLGEDARPVHADQPPRGAEVVLAREAVLAGAAADERIDACRRRRRPGRRPRARARAAARAARDGPR